MPCPTKPLKIDYILFILIYFLLNHPGAYSQETGKLLQKADNLFEQANYRKALKIYLRSGKKEGYSDRNCIQTGRCYERLNEYEAAGTYYEQLFYKSSSVDPIIFLEYGELLMKLNRPDDARSYFMSYNDLRALRYIESIEDYDKYFADSSFIRMEILPLSGAGNELNPVIFRDKLFILSNEKYYKSSPGEYDILYIEDQGEDTRKENLAGNNTGRIMADGFSIAPSTGEFIYSIYDPEKQSSDIYRAFIDDEGTRISRPEKISIGDFEYRISFPALNSDGSIMVFASDAPAGAGGWDLYICHRGQYGYSAAEPLSGFVNTIGDELYPWLLNDSVLFFASNGQGGVGGLDLFYINLHTPTVLPKNLGYPINSVHDEYGLCVSPDGRTGFLASERAGNSMADIYEFKLDKIRAWGEVTDRRTGNNLKNVAIDIVREGESTSQFNLADNGRFSITGDPGDAYNISVWKEGYELEKFYVNTSEAKVLGLYDVNMGRFPILKSEKPVTEPEITEPEPVAELKEPEPVQVDKQVPTVPAQGIEFRLQVAASRRPLTEKELISIYHGDHDIFMFTEDNWFKYAIGSYNSYYEANHDRKSCGVKNAFIAAYQDNKKIDLMAAIDRVNANSATISAEGIPHIADYRVISKQTIYYNSDGYEPRSGEDYKLKTLIDQLRSDQDLIIEIDGHTDIFGSKVYNLGLANERAEFIRSYLIRNGITSEGRIFINAYGESKLKKQCVGDCTPSIHSENRRVEIILYKASNLP